MGYTPFQTLGQFFQRGIGWLNWVTLQCNKIERFTISGNATAGSMVAGSGINVVCNVPPQGSAGSTMVPLKITSAATGAGQYNVSVGTPTASTPFDPTVDMVLDDHFTFAGDALAVNVDENPGTVHQLTIGQIVWGIALPQRTTSPYMTVYAIGTLANKVFAVDATQDGGSSGTSTTTCTYTYTVKTKAGVTLGTMVAPESSPGRVFPMTVTNPAAAGTTTGMAYLDNSGVLHLAFVNETTTVNYCPCTPCRDTCDTVTITVSGFVDPPEYVCSSLYNGTWVATLLLGAGCPTDGRWVTPESEPDGNGVTYHIGIGTTTPGTLLFNFTNVGGGESCGNLSFDTDVCCCPIAGTYIGTLGGNTITIVVS